MVTLEEYMRSPCSAALRWEKALSQMAVTSISDPQNWVGSDSTAAYVMAMHAGAVLCSWIGG